MTRLPSHLLRICAILAALLPLAAPQAQQDYPQKPIRIVVPFPPGGYSDVLARLIGAEFSKAFGQPGVVENRPGAGGNIGADVVAKSAPDGYTLVMGTIGTHAINATLYKNIPYDTDKDFAAVAFVADAETVLVVNPAVPARSVAELVALAKSKPDGITYASGGAGTTSHLAGELFKVATGADIVHIPYKGNAPALTDLVSGQVSMSFATLTPALPFIKSGKLIALATLGAARAPVLPDIPTLEEAGIKGFEVRNWTGFFAPAGTPPAILEKLAAQVDRTMQTPEVQAKLRNEGLMYTRMGPQAFAEFARAERDKWRKVVLAAGARAD
jgi:tripartite-type tricarboxylate transporter receptor subunit TctC